MLTLIALIFTIRKRGWRTGLLCYPGGAVIGLALGFIWLLIWLVMAEVSSWSTGQLYPIDAVFDRALTNNPIAGALVAIPYIVGVLACWYFAIVPAPKQPESVELTPAPSSIPVEETLAPSPTLTEEPPSATQVPTTFLKITGTGSKVTENYEWKPCKKAVFVWAAKAAASLSNPDNSIMVQLHGPDYKDVNVIFSVNIEAGKAKNGERLLPIQGGNYFLEIKAEPESSWYVRVECR